MYNPYILVPDITEKKKPKLSQKILKNLNDSVNEEVEI